MYFQSEIWSNSTQLKVYLLVCIFNLNTSFDSFREFVTSLSFEQIDNVNFVHKKERIWLIFVADHISSKEEGIEWQQRVLELRKESWTVRLIRKQVWDSKKELICLKIKYMMTGLIAVFARDLSVFSIAAKEADKFLDQYHLLGHTKGVHYVALTIPPHRAFRFEKNGINGIVAVAVFGRNIIRKSVGFEGTRSMEWVRFATLPSIRVVGGITKVFDYMYGLEAFDDIMTYVDIESNDAKGLQNIGFQVEEITLPIQLASGFNVGNYKLRYVRP